MRIQIYSFDVECTGYRTSVLFKCQEQPIVNRETVMFFCVFILGKLEPVNSSHTEAA
jgi:hypothetical protein